MLVRIRLLTGSFGPLRSSSFPVSVSSVRAYPDFSFHWLSDPWKNCQPNSGRQKNKHDTDAALIISIQVFTSLPFLLVAALIFWRKSDDWSALFAAFILLLLSTAISGINQRSMLLGSDIASFVVGGSAALLLSASSHRFL